MTLAAAVSLLTTALMLLQLVSANPWLPQSMRDQAQLVAQNAILEATRAIGPLHGVQLPVIPVSPPNAPTIYNFSGSTVGVSAGQPLTLSWSSNAANCHLWRNESNGGYTAVANLVGSATTHVVYPTVSSTYTLNCFYMPDGSGKDGLSTSRTFYVSVAPQTTSNVTLSASPIYGTLQNGTLWVDFQVHNYTPKGTEFVDFGDGTWTALGHTTATNARNDYHTAGTFTVKLLKDGAKGEVLASTMVTVLAPAQATPTVSLSSSPASLFAGQPATLNWSSTNANRCYLSDQSSYGGWTETVGVSGLKSIKPLQTTSYRLGCSNDPGTGKDGPSAEKTLTLYVTQPSVSFGGAEALQVNTSTLNTHPNTAFTVSGSISQWMEGPLYVVLVDISYMGGTGWSSTSNAVKDGSGFTAVSNTANISGSSWTAQFGGLPEGWYNIYIYDGAYNLKGNGFLVSTWKG